MIKSMTGYARKELVLDNFKFIIEVKSLNSKHIDINTKIPLAYRVKEIEIRKLLSEKLYRGKIDFSVWIEGIAPSSNHTINTEVAKDYYNQILKLKKDIGLTWDFLPMDLIQSKFTDIIPTLLKLPEVMKKSENKSDSNDWGTISITIEEVINDLIKYRLDEGEKLKQDIHLRLKNINTSLNEINPFAKKRIEEVKKNLSDKLDKLDFNHFDENRLEQELIYYLEKQDITEEQVRLSSHLEYFLEAMEMNAPNGKKLAFIAQEVGREINTIGAKSYDSEMQKIVVNMKDELEKIKEQLLNIL